MAGYAIDSQGLNNKAALLVTSLWTGFRDLREFDSWLNDATHTDAILTAAPYNVAQADLTAIRAAVTDLGATTGLYGVAHALKTQAATNDFFFNAKKLGGLYWAG